MATRPSWFQVGTVPEWVGLIVLLAGFVWGGAGLVNDIQLELQKARLETSAEITAIRHAVDSIQQSIEANARITVLERSQALNQVEKKLTGLTERVDRNWKNVDHLWEIVRDNQGKLRAITR